LAGEKGTSKDTNFSFRKRKPRKLRTAVRHKATRGKKKGAGKRPLHEGEPPGVKKTGKTFRPDT